MRLASELTHVIGGVVLPFQLKESNVAGESGLNESADIRQNCASSAQFEVSGEVDVSLVAENIVELLSYPILAVGCDGVLSALIQPLMLDFGSGEWISG